MTHTLLKDNRSPWNDLPIFSDYMARLFESSALLGHLKDSRTGKYIVSDEILALNYGFSSSKEVLGATGYDLVEYAIANNKIGYLAKFQEKSKDTLNEALSYDNRVLVDGVPNIHKELILSLSGSIYISKITKIPVFCKENKKVIAICTIDFNITDQYSLFYLFELYKKYFDTKKAIFKFLSHIQIVGYFSRMPTYREVTILLALSRNSASKYVTRQLEISPRTVDEYRSRITHKLKKPDLGELLAKIRTRYEKDNLLR